MKKYLIICLVLVAVIALPTLAQTTTDATTTATTTPVATTATSPSAELASLIADFAALRAKLLNSLIAKSDNQTLTEDQIRTLQALLAWDKTIYPEGIVTGKIGNLTRSAINRFARQTGLKGPARLLQEGAGKSGKIPPGLLTAPGIQKKLGTTTGSTTLQATTTSVNRDLMNRIRRLIRLSQNKLNRTTTSSQ